MSAISRRRILLSLAALGSAGLAVKLAPLDQLGTSEDLEFTEYKYLRFGEFEKFAGFKKENFYTAGDLKNRYAYQLDIESLRLDRISVGAAPHVIETHPSQLSLCLCSSQKSDTMSSIDWDSGREIGSIKLDNGDYFYGHAIFLPDGKSVLAAQYRTGRASVISRFSFPDLRQIASYEIAGGTPHEILLLDESTAVFGSSLGKIAAFGVLDLTTGQSKHHLVADLKENHSVISHLLRFGELFIGSYAQHDGQKMGPSGLATFDGRHAELALPPHESKFQTEVLSLAHDRRKNELWMTLPQEEMISLWKRENKPSTVRISSAELEIAHQQPNALAHDPRRGLTYLVTHSEILIMKTATRKLEARLPKPTFGYAAHARLA